MLYSIRVFQLLYASRRYDGRKQDRAVTIGRLLRDFPTCDGRLSHDEVYLNSQCLHWRRAPGSQHACKWYCNLFHNYTVAAPESKGDYSWEIVNILFSSLGNIANNVQSVCIKYYFSFNSDEIVVKFKEPNSYLYNIKTGTTPIIVHGNGPIKVMIQSMITDVICKVKTLQVLK